MTVHYWSARLVAKGPAVGVRTWLGPPLVDGEELDRSPRWQALVRSETTGRAILQGEPCPTEIEGCFLRNIEPITKAAYEYLIAHATYSTSHAPQNPDASPTEPVNFMTIKPF